MERDLNHYQMLCGAAPPDKECPAHKDGVWPQLCACYHRGRRSQVHIMAAILLETRFSARYARSMWASDLALGLAVSITMLTAEVAAWIFWR